MRTFGLRPELDIQSPLLQPFTFRCVRLLLRWPSLLPLCKCKWGSRACLLTHIYCREDDPCRPRPYPTCSCQSEYPAGFSLEWRGVQPPNAFTLSTLSLSCQRCRDVIRCLDCGKIQVERTVGPEKDVIAIIISIYTAKTRHLFAFHRPFGRKNKKKTVVVNLLYLYLYIRLLSACHRRYTYKFFFKIIYFIFKIKRNYDLMV